MERKSIILVLALLSPVFVFAQLKVAQSGNVSIQSSGTPLSAFSVGCDGESNIVSKITGNGVLMKIDGYTSAPYYYDVPIMPGPTDTLMPDYCYPKGVGLNVDYFDDISSSNGYAIGINSVTMGNSGASFAISGCVPGKGAAVYGSNSPTDYYMISGSYAGYFNGPVKATGTIYGTVVSSSDERLKENVKTLEADGASGGFLEKLSQLTPVSYNYKDPNAGVSRLKGTQKITIKGKTYTYEQRPNQVLEKTHFGLMAQELQQVYPNLVYEEDNGNLAINYTELIPVLMQSIKELNEKVEKLSGGVESRAAMSKAPGASLFDDDMLLEPTMSQNIPNPFSTSTDIAIYLPESVSAAYLHIYDLRGKQIDKQAVTSRGNTKMTIRADKMDDGMYIYALIADGKVVTSKKMIVSK